MLPQTEIPDNDIDEDCNGSDAHAAFTLTAAPSIADVIRGQSVSYAIAINGTAFTQLVDLALSGLPVGVTASFTPQHIAVGQTALLTVTVPNTQAPQTLPFSVSASATVNGTTETHAVPLTLNVLPVTTSFVGRTVVADDLQTPLSGVGVTLLGRNSQGQATGCAGETVSDAAGNFMFANLPPECTGGQLIRYDGTTATSPLGKYAGVDLFYDVVPNQVTTSPVLIHLPRIDDKEFVCVQQNAPQDQTFTFQTIPNMSVTVYAHTTFTPHPQYPPPAGRCAPGFFGLIAIDVPVDRLPDAMPSDMPEVMPFIVAFQPPNAVASQPVAVSFPNLLNTAPSTNMALMTLDPTKGLMVNYGTGTVSIDGTQIIPDLDPAHPDHRFGLVHFDWHGPAPTPPPQTNPSPDPCGPKTSNPIDLSSGLEVIRETDLAINGLRGGVFLQRVYRTLSNEAGPFGIGSSHNYRYRIDTIGPFGPGVMNLVTPDGNRFPLAPETPPLAGTLKIIKINNTIPFLRGVKVTVSSNHEVDMKWKDGTVFHFVPITKFAAGVQFLALGSVLESITDPNGNRTTLVRNPNRLDQITEIIDPVGRKLTLTYDGADRITDIIDPIGRTVHYTYNAQGTLETVTDPEGGVTRYDYDGQNRLIKVTDARGVVLARNTYDTNGRVIEQL
ncbi:MAG: RHS repeat protein [Deltaproteobacteria bacterium]|nr:RHS repeat protein [Deltaproteobacteria bacterium]